MKINALAMTALFLLILSGCASAPQQSKKEVPGYLISEKSCAVIIIGLPPENDQVKSNRMRALQFWSRITESISDRLFKNLEKEYSIYRYENEFKDASVITKKVEKAIAKHQCNRVVQVSYNVNQDTSGPFFEFKVTIFRVLPTIVNGNFTGANLDSVYERKYRYVRTTQRIKQFMDTPINQFVDQIIADAQQSGELNQLKK